MTERHTKTRRSSTRPGLIWLLLAMVLVVAALAGCSSDETESYTPPPATIIRASDQPAPTVAPPKPTVAAQPTVAGESYPLPQPPTLPAAPAASGATTPYPYPLVPTPRYTMTPFVYPTP